MNPTELKEIIREEIRASFKEIEKQWSEKFSEVREEIEVMKEEIKEIKKVTSEIEDSTNELYNKVDQLEEYTRLENVIISGVEYEDDENLEALMGKTIKIARELGVTMNITDISAIHRLYTRNVKYPPPIIVRLVNRWKKEQLISASKQKKMQGIYITNQLTPVKLDLLKKTKDLKRNGVVKYVWTAGNKILVRRSEKEESILISSMDTLIELGWKEEMNRRRRDRGEGEIRKEDSEPNNVVVQKKDDPTQRKQKQTTLPIAFSQGGIASSRDENTTAARNTRSSSKKR